MASGFNFFLNAIDITGGDLGAWVDIDVSAYIPVGATGVILETINEVAPCMAICLRKKGSADDRHLLADHTLHEAVGSLCGVDANRVFQVWRETANCKLWLLGYTDSSVQFFTDRPDKSLGGTLAWTDIDVSGDGVPVGATGVIIEITNNQIAQLGSIREKGSTDDRTTHCKQEVAGTIYGLCGLDANRKFQGWISNLNVDFFLAGYTLAPVVFHTNCPEVTDPTRDAWQDVDVTAQTSPTADGVIIEIQNGATAPKKAAIRKDGSSDDRTAEQSMSTSYHKWTFCGLAIGQIYEQYIVAEYPADTVKFWLHGYAQPAAAPTGIEDKSANMAAKMIAGKLI